MEIIRKQRCAIATPNGRFFVTAVKGGGKGELADKWPLHTDATKIKSWEQFDLVDLGAGRVAIRTAGGYYLTAVNGGGLGERADKYPIHTDSTHIDSWEFFNICYLDNGKCAIQTSSGNYLTAVKEGNMHEEHATINTDAVLVGPNESFYLVKLPNVK